MNDKPMWTHCFDLTASGATDAQIAKLPDPKGGYMHFSEQDQYELVEGFVNWCSHYLLKEARMDNKVRVRVIFNANADPVRTMLIAAILRAYYAWVGEVVWYDINTL